MNFYKFLHNYKKNKKKRIKNILDNHFLSITSRLKIQKKCPRCSKEHKKSGEYCSRYCSNSRIHSENTKNKIKKTMLNNNIVSFVKYRTKSMIKKFNTNKFKCIECWTIFFNISTFPVKYCSNTCRNSAHSKRMTNLISNNFHIKKHTFNYKQVSIRCDSILEEAAIIYLLDIFQVDSIIRCPYIVSYVNVNEQKRRMIPDFLAIKNKETYIIEVKMPYSKRNRDPYNKNIPFKKEHLKYFCFEKWYKDIWLDFNYDKRLRTIYKKRLFNLSL